MMPDRYTLITIVALCHVMHTLTVVGFRETRNWSLRPEYEYKDDISAKILETKGSVVLRDDGSLDYLSFSDDSEQQNAVSWGRYVDASKTASNFGKLKIKTSKEYDDDVQVFAAGYVEGRLTAFRIRQNYENLHSYFTRTMNASLEEPMKWIKEQDMWVRGQCRDKTGLDMPEGRPAGEMLQHPHEGAHMLSGKRHKKNHKRKHKHDEDHRYWLAVCLAIRQFDGIVFGYNQAAMEHAGDDIPAMAYDDLLFLESNGDLYDIIDMMDPSQRPTWGLNGGLERTMMKAKGIHEAGEKEEAAERLFRSIALSGKCSALVKITPDLREIYMGHSTWDSFTAMLRIYKHYEFDLQQLSPAAQKVSFSSYPGEVFSDDDFYILSSKMVLLQTTNKIFNDGLFKHLKTDSVLSWQRVRAANWLGSSGKEWVDVFKKENSGTYNNQYMVIDLKKFRPGEDALPGLLWVAEQIPGQVQSADMTRMLMMAAYWPSMNIPHFPKIYEASGYPDFINQISEHGKEFTKVCVCVFSSCH